MNTQTAIPPNSLESEQSLLGGLMLDNRAWDEIADIINKQDFYHPSHQIIFNTVADLIEHSKPADIVTVQEYLLSRSLLDEVGGFDYLTTISMNTPSVGNIKAYAQQIKETSIKRSLINGSNDIIGKVYSKDGTSSADILDYAEQSIFKIAEDSARNKQRDVHISEGLKSVVEATNHAAEHGIESIKTGFSALDKLTSGLHPGDLIIIAGRPSMGKTAFAMNLIENIAIHATDKKTAVVFSLEMSAEQLLTRMVSSYGKIDAQKIKNGLLDADEWDKFNQTIAQLDTGDIIIDETAAITPMEIRAKCRRLKRKYPNLGLVMIDYLQLMNVGGSVENRVQELSQISRSLKGLARELNVPVLALSQLNRGVESRPKPNKGRMPQMADLRESGAIEQDADMIAFVYRDEAYHDDSYQNPDEIGKADIKLAKNRNGPIGTVKLSFQKEFARFSSYAGSDEITIPSEASDIAYERNQDNFSPEDLGFGSDEDDFDRALESFN